MISGIMITRDIKQISPVALKLNRRYSMTNCSIELCDNPHLARGVCRKHYSRIVNKNGGRVKDPIIRVGENRKQNSLYSTYNVMLQRCNPKFANKYPRYSGRGVRVCDRWLGIDGFSNFLNDMGERPTGYTLDRVDNDGDYSPDNCRWATPLQQSRNRGVLPTSVSGVSGVVWLKRDKRWRAEIVDRGKHICIGFFTDMDEAILSRKQAELKYWGKL